MRQLLLIAAILLATAHMPSPLEADPPNRERGDVIKLTVHPAGPSVPSLKHPLLPEVRDLRPGNAALLYYRSFSPDWWFYGRPEIAEKLQKWQEMPLANAAQDKELRGLMRSKQLQEVDLAARRIYCDWELNERARAEGFSLLLPDLQSLRTIGTGLSLRSRIEIADGKFDDAVRTFQTGFTLGRHLGEAPILINDLVGLVIATRMVDRLEEFVQQPKAPNLYWGLSGLPEPFIDLRRSFEGEKYFALESLCRPVLEQPMKPVTSQELQKMMGAFHDLAGDEPGKSSVREQAALLGLALKNYPADKKFLVDYGLPADEVARLPMLQVSLLAGIYRYHAFMDDIIKWSNIPYRQARPHLEQITHRVKELRASATEGFPITSLLLPAVDTVRLAVIRLDRRIAVMRCIEALRLYAAAHEGRLPASLSDIKEVPIPDDPLTGKPFEYRVEGNRAFLRGPPTHPAQGLHAINYEIVMQK